MSKFRIKKETLVDVLSNVIKHGMLGIPEYAKKYNKSESTVADFYAEIRRAFKRGDITPVTADVMEFFLRTSKREGSVLDNVK
jgi:hypothetical protein